MSKSQLVAAREYPTEWPYTDVKLAPCTAIKTPWSRVCEQQAKIGLIIDESMLEKRVAGRKMRGKKRRDVFYRVSW